MKKIEISRFINTELKSDSDSELDSEAESKFDTELMAKVRIFFWFCVSHFTCFKQVKRFCYFAGFEQVKKLIDGQFFDGCSLDGCFLDGYSLDDCF